MLTLDTVRSLVPKSQRTMVNEGLIDQLNKWNEDPKLLESFKDNVLSYIGVLKDGKFKIQDYMNAVRYVSYKLIGHSDIDAYAITFPDRYQRLVDDGQSRDDISPYVSAYKKNMLVVKIFEQTIVPTNVLNAPMHQEAINELMRIGINGRSEVARVSALSKVVDITAPDSTMKIQLDVSHKESDALSDLKSQLADIASDQLKAIDRGQASVKQLGALKPVDPDDIIEVEVDV